MNALLLWFHRTGSPPNFDRFCARWAPWCFGIALVLLLPGLYGALFAVPTDYKQGDSFRILYVHVPAAWSAMFIFVAMAVQAFIALVWRIKACETLAVAAAPVGAAFAAITLITGSIWGRPTWGTWWEWDPRLTSMLVMFFLYLGVIALHNAIEDRRSARAACFLALIGVINVPIVHFSVHWWNSLHQGETINLTGGESQMHASMLWPLMLTTLATKFWFVGSLLQRARTLNLENESAQPWARELATGGPLMEHLHGWFVAAAYAVFAVILLADAILPRMKFKSLLRGILLRERRSANTTRNASTADTP